jgi:hypothetical protein
VDLPIGLGTGLAKGIEEEEAIGIIAEDGFPAVANTRRVSRRGDPVKYLEVTYESLQKN